jgi:prepilin-type N-terminal cleavage/methylation domain-containing protein
VTEQAKSNSGFTLLEVLVSFAILSMTVIVGFQVFGEGLSRVARVEKVLDETALAKHMLSLPLSAGGAPATGPLVKQAITEVPPDWTPARPILLRMRSGDQGNEFETIVIQGEGK